jgi:transcriptional regulator with XRE-family HTH domain
MEINLKEKLRSLRQQKNVTQEALANHLGITPQSVGKWERGEGYPDITLLPKIAFYFDVTVDELLCVDQVRVDEKIEEYKRQADDSLLTGDVDRFLEIWERAYEEFPNDCRVIHGLMAAINIRGERPCPLDKAKRIFELGETLLQKSTDVDQREGAIQSLCYTYQGIDDEKALYYANMGGSLYTTREGLKSDILDGEEGVVACQEYLMFLIQLAAMTATRILEKAEFSPEYKIEAFSFAIDIIKRLFVDDNVGYSAFWLSYYYRCMAGQYAELNDAEKTIESLKESCRYAVIEARLDDLDYTAPMVNRMKHIKNDIHKNYKGNSCNMNIRGLKDGRFDFVRNEETFKRIVADLEKYAEPVS